MTSPGRLPTVPLRKLVTIDFDIEAGMTACRAEMLPGASDSELIRAILRDWLIGRGYIELPPAKADAN